MNYCLISLEENNLMTKIISKKEAERLKRLEERKAKKQELSMAWARRYLKHRGYVVDDYVSTGNLPADVVTLPNGVKVDIDRRWARLYKEN
jgi:hypothetical protein